MAKIKVTRKSYIRKEGTVVKETTYYTEDKGKPGKTPESQKFYHPKVEMNWHKEDSEETRGLMRSRPTEAMKLLLPELYKP